MQQGITPNLWFDTEAEEAAAFYCSIFEGSRIVSVSRYPEGSPGEVGTVMTVEFEVNGQRFVGINGGPQFTFNLSWQVVPAGMAEVLGDPDPERSQRAMQAMLGMHKLDVAALRRAADGAP